MTNSAKILALDQGTTHTKGILVDKSGKVVWQTSHEISQVYPQAGWVEQDPEEIYRSCTLVAEKLLEETETDPNQIWGIGITNQRETTVVWDRESGVPVANAIVWQCRRTGPICEAMKTQGLEEIVRSKTGLPIDPYFSATKIRWILDHTDNGQRRAETGDLLFGTVDTWLLWKFTNGTLHATDVSNASRTMLFDIDSLTWDKDLLQSLDIPEQMLPEVRSSSEVYGHTSGKLFNGQAVPIAGIAGDQHAALFGQACFEPGMAKNTYGTGCFVLMNTGTQRVSSTSGLIHTIGWKLGDQVTYALEGSIFSTGATVQWLRDGLQIIDHASDLDALAATVPDNGGVFLIPAFTGLGAPHWDMYARGTVLGITRGTDRAHIARAALESSAYQTRDVIEAMLSDTGMRIPRLRVDGGGTASQMLMQFQADILATPIEPSAIPETTALGAAYLAGLATGFWSGQEELTHLWSSDAHFEPKMAEEERHALYSQWKRALERAAGWARDWE